MPYAELTHLEWSRRLVARINLASSAAPVPPPRVLGLDRRAFPGATSRDATPWYLPQLDLGDSELQERIGTRYGVDPKRVVLVAGASEGHFLVQMLLRGKDGGDALCETPGYGPHRGVANAFPGCAIDLPRDSAGRVDFSRVHDAAAAHVRVATLSDPHNPSGMPLDADDVTALVRWADQRRVDLVIDEVFREADPTREPGSWAALHPYRVWSVSSLTKGFGLGSLRLGWVIAPADQAEALRRVQSYTTVIAPGPSVVLGRAVLAHADEARAWVLAALAKNRERFARQGGWPVAGTTAFVRLRAKGNGQATVPDTGDVCRALLKEHGVAVVPGEFFGDRSGFRVGFGVDRREFAEGWTIVRQVLKERGLASVR
jgi:aspartate/methionine/tyrosine aminotransferase